MPNQLGHHKSYHIPSLSGHHFTRVSLLSKTIYQNYDLVGLLSIFLLTGPVVIVRCFFRNCCPHSRLLSTLWQYSCVCYTLFGTWIFHGFGASCYALGLFRSGYYVRIQCCITQSGCSLEIILRTIIIFCSTSSAKRQVHNMHCREATKYFDVPRTRTKMWLLVVCIILSPSFSNCTCFTILLFSVWKLLCSSGSTRTTQNSLVPRIIIGQYSLP